MATAREAVEYFDELQETFSTRGWKQLIEEAKSQLYQYQADVLEIGSWDKVCELRGQVMQLSRLINLEEVTATLKAQAEHQVLEDLAESADL